MCYFFVTSTIFFGQIHFCRPVLHFWIVVTMTLIICNPNTQPMWPTYSESWVCTKNWGKGNLATKKTSHSNNHMGPKWDGQTFPFLKNHFKPHSWKSWCFITLSSLSKVHLGEKKNRPKVYWTQIRVRSIMERTKSETGLALSLRGCQKCFIEVNFHTSKILTPSKRDLYWSAECVVSVSRLLPIF